MTHPIIAYLDAITIPNATERAARVEALTAEDVVYSHTHAPSVLRGREQLFGLLEAFAVHKPTTTWEPVGETETHHDAFRQRYRTIDDGVVRTEGTYTGTTDATGRLQLILGFIDRDH